jgi:hypothetical protein
VIPGLSLCLAQLRGRLSARASLESPCVSVAVEPGEAPLLRIEEGGVSVELEFPDAESIRRFQHQVGSAAVPDDEP